MKQKTQAVQTANWYDYPQYYDLLCAEETHLESRFIRAACERYCPFPVRNLLEPGCGSGRLVVALARQGFHLTGYDLNEQSLNYARRKLARLGLQAQLEVGDMTQFVSRKPVDAAYCLINTFRHLLTEEDELSHLRCMARSLRRGGIYLLGMHLLPPDVDDESIERWQAQRGNLRVTATLRVMETNRRQRWERIRLSLRARSAQRDIRLRTEFRFRRYCAAQFRRLLAKVPEFELRDVFDFCYDIEEPLALNDQITDTVFVLRRR